MKKLILLFLAIPALNYTGGLGELAKAMHAKMQHCFGKYQPNVNTGPYHSEGKQYINCMESTHPDGQEFMRASTDTTDFQQAHELPAAEHANRKVVETFVVAKNIGIGWGILTADPMWKINRRALLAAQAADRKYSAPICQDQFFLKKYRG